MKSTVNVSFDEIRVYEGVAERTGVLFHRNAVRRSRACCTSLTELGRKVRSSGDGDFYLPLGLWPADTERVDLQRRWIVLSSPLSDRPSE
ncbi:MAG TPA: hypothetical protein VMU84_10710 [Thermoanaerobaculia bacterium]|nr:hypothetical protein [Thermoanaerobaculia bacterium]